MKYSNYIGVVASLLLIVSCFFPWAYIPSLQSNLTGLNTAGTNFGKPGMLHIIIASMAIILFIVPAVWAKRVNVFLGALNLAWLVRNFILFGLCELGECPEKKYGIYLAIFTSLAIMAMALFPSGTSKTGKE